MHSGSCVPATSLSFDQQANSFQYQDILASRPGFSQVLPVLSATQAHTTHLTSKQLAVSTAHRNKNGSFSQKYALFWICCSGEWHIDRLTEERSVGSVIYSSRLLAGVHDGRSNISMCWSQGFLDDYGILRVPMRAKGTLEPGVELV